MSHLGIPPYIAQLILFVVFCKPAKGTEAVGRRVLQSAQWAVCSQSPRVRIAREWGRLEPLGYSSIHCSKLFRTNLRSYIITKKRLCQRVFQILEYFIKI